MLAAGQLPGSIVHQRFTFVLFASALQDLYVSLREPLVRSDGPLGRWPARLASGQPLGFMCGAPLASRSVDTQLTAANGVHE